MTRRAQRGRPTETVWEELRLQNEFDEFIRRLIVLIARERSQMLLQGDSAPDNIHEHVGVAGMGESNAAIGFGRTMQRIPRTDITPAINEALRPLKGQVRHHEHHLVGDREIQRQFRTSWRNRFRQMLLLRTGGRCLTLAAKSFTPPPEQSTQYYRQQTSNFGNAASGTLRSLPPCHTTSDEQD